MSIVFSKKPTVAVASAARTATGSSGSIDVGHQDFLSLMLDVTAVSGTTPSLTLSVEWSHDGATWFTADPVDTFTAVTASGKKVKLFQVKGTVARVTWTISGTTPSFTFSVTSITGS